MPRTKKKSGKKKAAAFRETLSRTSTARDAAAPNDPSSGAIARQNTVSFGASAPFQPNFPPPPPPAPAFQNSSNPFLPTHMQQGYNHYQQPSVFNPFPDMQFIPGMFVSRNSPNVQNFGYPPQFNSYSTNVPPQNLPRHSFFGNYNAENQQISNLNPNASPFMPAGIDRNGNNGKEKNSLLYFCFTGVVALDLLSILVCLEFVYCYTACILLSASSVLSE